MTSAVLLDSDFEDYWAAVARGDERGAQAVALGVRDAGGSLESVLRDLVVQAQLRVGDLWATNRWTVPREHAATAVGESVVRRLAVDLAEPAEGPGLLVACVEREWHALPALVLATTLRARGERVTYLGASSTRDQLVSRIVDQGPRAVLLSASLTSSLPRARRHIDAVRATGTPVVVGGRAFDTAGVRARRLGATAYAAGPEDLLDVLPSLPRHVPFSTPLRHAAAAEARGIQSGAESISRDVIAELRHRLHLEATPGPDGWAGVLVGHVSHVVDSLAGALLVEDPTVMSEARTWLSDVLAGRGADAGADPGAVDLLWATLADRLRDYPEALRLLEAR